MPHSQSPSPSPTRTLLPMVGQTHGNRSAVTCHLRCGDACSAPVPNTTETSYFRDIAATVLSRRSVVGTGVSVAALTGRPDGARRRRAGARPAAGQGRPRQARQPPVHARSRPPPPPSTTSPSRSATAGTRSCGGATRSSPARPPSTPRNQTPEAQAGQFGYNNDYLDIIETNRAGTERAARVQPRVHQRGHHVPARHRPGDRDPHGVGRARHVGGRAHAAASAATCGPTSRARASTAGSPSTPRSPSTGPPPVPTC